METPSGGDETMKKLESTLAFVGPLSPEQKARAIEVCETPLENTWAIVKADGTIEYRVSNTEDGSDVLGSEVEADVVAAGFLG